MLTVQRPTGGFFVDSALGWTVDARGGGEIIWKNGGTGGYRSFIGYSRKARAGVVVLSNATAGIDDIGLHLLDSRFRLAGPLGFPKEATVDASVLDRHVGRYELSPHFVLTITRDGDHLFAQATGQQRFKLVSDQRPEILLQGGRGAADLRDRRPRPDGRPHLASKWREPTGKAHRGGCGEEGAVTGDVVIPGFATIVPFSPQCRLIGSELHDTDRAAREWTPPQ